MSVNMNGEHGDYEQVTGTVASTNGESRGIQAENATKEILDLDEIVDRRDEVAELVSVYHRLLVHAQDAPQSQRTRLAGTAKVGTAQNGFDVGGRAFPTKGNNVTDSMDPIGPVLHDTASAGESQLEGSSTAGIGSGDGGHGSGDSFRFEFHRGDRLIADRLFDARDSVQVVFDAASTNDDNRFVMFLTFQYLFELRPA